MGLAAVAALTGQAALAAEHQTITYPSLDGTPIKAELFLPSGAEPKATVVAFHGCGGLYSTRSTPDAPRLTERHQGMADLLTRQGYAALFPDSFGPRGEREICTSRIKARRTTPADRRRDALAALDWVAQQGWARADRLAILGWSHGGSTVLSATDAGDSDVRARRVAPQLAIAFYPGCSDALRAGYRTLPPTRLHLLLAELDDWTSPAHCVSLGEKAGAQVELFAGAYHGFDAPSGQVQLRKDVPNGVNAGQGVHMGPHAPSRERAYRLLLEWLAEAFP